ncbi:MAG: hypothetical protein KGL35_10790 [Bradyrhizobium sp.]|nr:hypothetical protein [Bradyrhizobium sp.]
MQSWPIKDPDEVLDYDINWAMRLYSADELISYNAAVALDPSKALPVDPATVVVPADTIATSTFTLPLGITSTQASFTNTKSKIWLSGGTVGASYEILNRITTAGGRTMDQTVKIKLKEK